MTKLKLLLVSDTLDWHARRMEAAYAEQGVEVVRIDLKDCDFTTASPTGLNLPGISGLPDIVHVRTMSGGTFEAITKRLGVLHALKRLGTPVFNTPQAIEACVDKSMTSFLISHAGIATPSTWTLESFEHACALTRREIEWGPLVLKPLFGAQGKGLRLLRSVDDLPSPAEVAGVYYLQRFEPAEAPGFQDFRVFVAGGRPVATMMRRAPTWITNVKQGGEPYAIARDAELENLALASARAVGAEIAGIDIILGRNGPRVLEVNSMPAWSGLQKVTRTNIAAAIAECVLSGAEIERHC